MYTPDKWVIIKISTKEETLFKVLASFYGGFIGGDSWQMNSGIESVEFFESFYKFKGFSGSEYRCAKDAYGMSFLAETILSRLLETSTDEVKIELLEDQDWGIFFKNQNTK